MRTYSLHLGSSKKTLAHVIPDNKHPGMSRIKWQNGETSDMVNLARAKDAAKIIAARNLSTATTIVSPARFSFKVKETDPVAAPVQ